jgi:hypothetical protein
MRKQMLEKLANGYTVIAEKPESNPGQMTGMVVLAVNDDLTQYAVWWRRDEDRATFNGDYFPLIAFGGPLEQFVAASMDYRNRKGY